MTTKPVERQRYFLTLCGALGKLGDSATDVMYQLLTRTDMDDEHVLGAYRIRHGLNMGNYTDLMFFVGNDVKH